MKLDRFTIIALKIVQILTGGIAIYSLWMLLLHNEPIALFDFEPSQGRVLNTIAVQGNASLVTYEYDVGGEISIDQKRIWNKLLYEDDKIVEFRISYNTLFPSINRINNFTLHGGYYTGLVWGLSMFSIFALIDILADKDKWVNLYSKLFSQIRGITKS
ncbi:MAG: hypothetical protein L6Q94_19395 [Calditrichia bacterium]|nr:hypothetical protein [Calditrichia bacterium]